MVSPNEIVDTEIENYTVTVTSEDRENFKRLDVWLAQKLPQFSRSTLRRLFDDEEISSETPLLINKMPPAGTVIEIEVPPPIETSLIAENIPLEILFEDAHLIIINKPAGLVVHPAPGHYTGTLVNALIAHCGSPRLLELADQLHVETQRYRLPSLSPRVLNLLPEPQTSPPPPRRSHAGGERHGGLLGPLELAEGSLIVSVQHGEVLRQHAERTDAEGLDVPEHVFDGRPRFGEV